jgi:long-subunit fatty acid transport protein
MSKARRAARGRKPASEERSARKAQRRRGFLVRRYGDVGEVAFLHKAMGLGYMVAQPYGNIYPFDFIVQGGKKLWRVQVKSVAYMKNGSYYLTVRRSVGRKLAAYSKAEVDFIAVYIIPEDIWYILPVSEIKGRQFLLFRPQGPDGFARRREGWRVFGRPGGPAV